jgi:hypothetical protein
MVVNTETTQNVNFKYTREELARLSLEQIAALWREQIAAPVGITEERNAIDTGRRGPHSS